MAITGTTFAIWIVLLVLQNASFTWVSRARNSGSDWYHAIAAVFSNGIWFAANFFTFGQVLDVMRTGSWTTGVVLGVAYVAATVFGSVTTGWFLRTHVEKGSRRVGHYDEKVKAAEYKPLQPPQPCPNCGRTLHVDRHGYIYCVVGER